MEIIERVKLGNNNYYIKCNCEYKNRNGNTILCLKNYQNDYYDGGDLSTLIKKIERYYDKPTIKKYDGENWFLSDCLYIYDNIPFIEGIGDFYVGSSDKIIYSASYITKEELDNYIKDNNIKMCNNKKFKLSDERTWNISELD